MKIASCVAHALLEDLDVVEAAPELYDVPVENLELAVDRYLDELEDRLIEAIESEGLPYLKSQDAAGLCTVLLPKVRLPLPMLLQMCRTIVELYEQDEF